MNREIKFKIHSPKGIWIYEFSAQSQSEWQSFGLREAIINDYPILQYTGFKDKSGVEIYKGDIVKVRGTKRAGLYTDEVIESNQGFTLKANKTYFNNDACLCAILEVIRTTVNNLQPANNFIHPLNN